MYSYLKVPVRKLKIGHFSDLSLGLCRGLCTECSKTHGNIIPQGPKCNITILPEGAPPLPPTPLLEVALAPKIHEKRYAKTHRKKGTYLGTLLATPATKKEHSGALGSQNDSKMESKTEPKVIQKGSLLKNTKK